MLKVIRRKVIVLGARGLVGHVLFNQLAVNPNFDCYGTVKGKNIDDSNFLHPLGTTVSVHDLRNRRELNNTLEAIGPDLIINCLSLPKTQNESVDALQASEALSKSYQNSARHPRR